MWDAWSDLHGEVHEVCAVDDRAFVSVTPRGKGRVSGVEIEASFFHVGTIRGRKILSCRDYADRNEALKAFELQE
jgi:ketosteroid isomerase-like protein